MTIRLKIAWGEGSEQILMKMAAWSAVAHVVALIVFSLLPRFTEPIRPPQATIATIVPASSLLPAAPTGGGKPDAAAQSPPPELTPSQRADAAKQASRPKAPPPLVSPPKNEKLRKPEPRKETEPTGSSAPASSDAPPAPAPSTPSGAGISFGGATGPGGIPSIGSSAFPYDYYRSSLVAILQSNWRRPVAPEGLKETLTCRIQFTILKTGIVQDPKIVQPSGNESLDQSALRAVYNSNPLPPLPFQYGQASVSAEVVFELTSD